MIDSKDAHAHAHAHANEWLEAFAESNILIGFDSVRRKIGKWSDHLISELTEISSESTFGKSISKHHGEIFRTKYLPSLKPFSGAKELLQFLIMKKLNKLRPYMMKEVPLLHSPQDREFTYLQRIQKFFQCLSEKLE